MKIKIQVIIYNCRTLGLMDNLLHSFSVNYFWQFDQQAI